MRHQTCSCHPPTRRLKLAIMKTSSARTPGLAMRLFAWFTAPHRQTQERRSDAQLAKAAATLEQLAEQATTAYSRSTPSTPSESAETWLGYYSPPSTLPLPTKSGSTKAGDRGAADRD